MPFFFFLIFMAALGLSCGTQDLRCGTWDPLLWRAGSSLWCTGFSLVVASGLRACGLCSCGVWALWLWPTCSGVVAHGLSCPASCGILVP